MKKLSINAIKIQNFKGIKDLKGELFGRLAPIRISGKDKHGAVWECRCSCGSIVNIQRSLLISGNTKSCGCIKREILTERNRVHSLCMQDSNGKKPRIYNIWVRMRQRCKNPNSSDYSGYGGRGISVCDEWESFESFYKWSMGNGYRDGLSIERIDNSAGYAPENCSWVTPELQSKNKRNNHRITFNGETKILTDWAKDLSIDQSLLRYRIKNWGVERAFSSPIRGEK